MKKSGVFITKSFGRALCSLFLSLIPDMICSLRESEVHAQHVYKVLSYVSVLLSEHTNSSVTLEVCSMPERAQISYVFMSSITLLS